MLRSLVRLLCLTALAGCLSEVGGDYVAPPDTGPRPDTGVRWGDAGELLQEHCPDYEVRDGCSGSAGPGGERCAVSCTREGRCFLLTLERADGGWAVAEGRVGQGSCPSLAAVPVDFTGSVGVVDTPTGQICAASLDGTATFALDGGTAAVSLQATEFRVGSSE